MKAIDRFGKVPASIIALILSAGLGGGGCTTTAVNPPSEAGGGSSGGSGSSGGIASSGGSSGGSGSSSSGGSGSGGGSGGSSGGTDASITEAGSSGGDGGPLTAPTCSAAVPQSPDGGALLISDFSRRCTGMDGGMDPYNACFGAYPGYFGGTYFYPSGPPAVAGPGLAGADQTPNDAGNNCVVPLSQNSFLATVMPSNKSWVLSGTVAGFTGAGMYIQSSPNLCVDASAYAGVQFTISGTTGSADAGVTDAGVGEGGGSDAAVSAPLIQFKVIEAGDIMPTTTAGSVGTCTASMCTPASYSFALPSTPTTITVHWTDLVGRVPSSPSDPAHLTGIEWALPWACTGSTPYPVNISIQNVMFVK
ncbi:MAG: hypothetical protein M3O46_21655 [Myxococcota bacterium]|nr:hypothetical protein [Myxococcota bacterium]